MNNSNKFFLASLALALLGACASPMKSRMTRDMLNLRTTAVVSQQDMTAKKTVRFLGQNYRVTDKDKGLDTTLRLDGTKFVSENTAWGGYADLGHVGMDDVRFDHGAIGLIFRSYTGNLDSKTRFYLEGRGGFRMTWIEDFYGEGFDAGLATGVELRVGRATALHAQVGYDYGTTNANETDTSFSGLTFGIGGSVRF